MPFDGSIAKGQTNKPINATATSYDKCKAGDLPYSEKQRQRQTAKHESWLSYQSRRLGISEHEILELIKRGWLPHYIEGTPANCLSDFERAPGVAAILAGRPIFDPC